MVDLGVIDLLRSVLCCSLCCVGCQAVVQGNCCICARFIVPNTEVDDTSDVMMGVI